MSHTPIRRIYELISLKARVFHDGVIEGSTSFASSAPRNPLAPGRILCCSDSSSHIYSTDTTPLLIDERMSRRTTDVDSSRTGGIPLSLRTSLEATHERPESLSFIHGGPLDCGSSGHHSGSNPIGACRAARLGRRESADPWRKVTAAAPPAARVVFQESGPRRLRPGL